MHGNYLSPLKRTLIEKYFLSSTVYNLDCFLCPEGGSCLINSLLIFVPKILVLSIFGPCLSPCQQVFSGGLGFLTVMELLCDSESSLEQLFFVKSSDLAVSPELDFMISMVPCQLRPELVQKKTLKPSCAPGYTQRFLPGFRGLMVSFGAALGCCS